MKKILYGVLLFSLVFAVSCAKKGEEKSPATGGGGVVVAKIGSGTITEEDMKRELKGLPPQIQMMFEGPAGMERFVDELVKKEILYQEAKKKGLENSDEFKKKVDDFKKLTLIGILLEKEIEQKSKLSDKEAKEYYESHKADFTSGQVRASHILVKSEDEAKQLLEQLKKGGDFGKLAAEKSIDAGSAKNGGDLGFFSKGQMVPEFDKVAFGLKKGEMSGIVKTQFGFHILKVTDRKEGQAPEFDKVKEMLVQKITAQKQKEAFDGYLKTLRETYKPEVNKEALAKLAASGDGKKDTEKGDKKDEKKEEKKEKK